MQLKTPVSQKSVPDRALECDCPYTGKVFITVLRNALHAPSMEHNVIPPFVMRAGGVIVNYVPKTRREHPAVDDHSVSFDHSDLQMPLQLNGMFSFFHTRVPTEIERNECENMFLAPDSSDWNPYYQSRAQ